MDPVLLFEMKPNESFSNLKAGMVFINNDHSYQLAVDTDCGLLMASCRYRTDDTEYWCIRHGDYCLVMCMQFVEHKMYPIEIEEFIQRNREQIGDLFIVVSLQRD